jgi:hypothetical protein
LVPSRARIVLVMARVSRSALVLRLLLSLPLCPLAATGCDSSDPTGPTVPLNEQFVLAPDETATILEAGIRIRFVGVFGDSRCPADVVCVTGGDAIVRIEVLSFGAGLQPYELHTGDMRPVQHGDLTIALIQLDPYPFSAGRIQPGDYRATLRVSRCC